jgi:tRNA pseudouridine32 synthase / 23S rRNA pseudouridine746 synthase
VSVDRKNAELARERLKGVRVVARGSGWIAVDKPSGVLSVPGKGEAGAVSVVSWVMEHEPIASGPITVHRLDMDTSGLLLVGLNAETQRALSMQFEARTVEKRYIAVVTGRVAAENGTFDVPMRLDVPNRPRQIVDHEQGKAAVTEYRVLSREAGPPRTRLELVPLTGRTHQLRVHCAHAGHPILGDMLYGDAASSPRLLLHAAWLAITDPSSGQRIEIESPPPF